MVKMAEDKSDAVAGYDILRLVMLFCTTLHISGSRFSILQTNW